MQTIINDDAPRDEYLHGRGPAWFAFAMTVGLMLFDYIDRQVIVSLFPHIKAEWNLSDKQLGALVSIVSITVGIGAIPVALVADRVSRVKAIFVMAFTWSLACVACMFTRNYSQLLLARAVVGAGEAGYGSVGSALIASHFPSRMRSALMACFFASASIGSVLGVILGGVIASHWGWKAAFGVVGFPGLIMALLYLKVKDYHTVALQPQDAVAVQSIGGVARSIVAALGRSRTMMWACIGGALQTIVVSSVWAWTPSYLNRFHELPVAQASIRAAIVVLAGAIGAVVAGIIVDRAGRRQPRYKLFALAMLCLFTMLVLGYGFGEGQWFGQLQAHEHERQFWIIVAGSFFMTCASGPVTAIVIDVVHPAVRATGGSVLALFLNLFGLAAGPFISGMLSDAVGLRGAMAIMPAFGALAAVAFIIASRYYEGDMRAVQQTVRA